MSKHPELTLIKGRLKAKKMEGTNTEMKLFLKELLSLMMEHGVIIEYETFDHGTHYEDCLFFLNKFGQNIDVGSLIELQHYGDSNHMEELMDDFVSGDKEEL